MVTAKKESIQPPTVLEQYQAGQISEWEAYVASQVIDIDGARAFNPGDAVPASHVERGVVKLTQVIARSEVKEEIPSSPAPVVLRGGGPTVIVEEMSVKDND